MKPGLIRVAVPDGLSRCDVEAVGHTPDERERAGERVDVGQSEAGLEVVIRGSGDEASVRRSHRQSGERRGA